MINSDKERTSWASDEIVLYPPLDQINEILVKSTGDYISVSHLTFNNDLLAISVGSYPNILEAVNTISGDTLWTFEILESGGSMNYVCAQNDSMIFAGGQQGLGLYALDSKTGKQLWSKPIGSLYTRSIILDGTNAYILGDSIYCLSIKDGSTIWSRNRMIRSTPAVDDLYVYVVGDYKAQVFDKLSGELVWWRPVSERTSGATVVDDDCFYTQSNDTIFAYNKGSWDVNWIYESPGDTIIGQTLNSMAITDSKLCFIINGNEEGKRELVTLNKKTGEFLWAQTFSGYYLDAPVMANGVVYVIPYPEAALYGFELENGTQLFYDNSFSYRGQAIVANHQLFAAAQDRIVVFGNAETSAAEWKGAALQTPVLMQNYPNPFCALTTIRFSLLQREFVEMKVYNTLGEEVKDLINEERAPGMHSVDFDGTHLPGGVYFYKISAGSFADTRQLLLIK
jgi:outer membrane protein assembly factor BamB